ncbi:MAG: hypothetical protein Q9165_003622 [Trypethelium subeluteriae]
MIPSHSTIANMTSTQQAALSALAILEPPRIGAAKGLNAGMARKLRIYRHNKLMNFHDMHRFDQTWAPHPQLRHWASSPSSKTADTPPKLTPPLNPNTESFRYSLSLDASIPGPSSPPRPLGPATASPDDVHQSASLPSTTPSATPPAAASVDISMEDGNDATDGKPIITTNIRPFRLGHPEPERLSFHLLHHQTGQVRSYVYLQKVDWCSRASINSLNKWKAQILRRCTGKNVRKSITPYLKRERDWIQAYRRKHSGLSDTDLADAFNKEFAGKVVDGSSSPRPMRSRASIQSDLARTKIKDKAGLQEGSKAGK